MSRLPPPRRSLLLPFSPLYGAALVLEQRLRSAFPRQKRTLPGIVLSIGSLSAGGAGKTPVVGSLSTLLRDRGYPVRILSRGYGRRTQGPWRGPLAGVETRGPWRGLLAGVKTRNIALVDPAGDSLTFGDEPLLLARTTRVPVLVGADRYQAGLVSLEHVPPPPGTLPVFLLDDGFQHRHLARDLDIVLLTGTDVEDRLLPSGSLREPLSALRRADVIVVREEEAEALTRFVEVLLRPAGLDPLLWVVRRALHLPVGSVPSRPLVFSGIARPAGFHTMLQAAGVELSGRVSFRDHQHLGRSEVQTLLRAARRSNSNGFVTTAKDAVRLSPALRQQLEDGVGPVITADLQTEFVDVRQTLEQLVNAVPRLDRRKRKRSR